MADQRPLGTIERILFLASCGVGAAVFLTVGWTALAPDNPRGAVSLLARHAPWLTLIEAGGLCAVVSGVATLLIGRRLPLAGVFAAAVGLGVVSLRGQTAAYLLVQQAGSPAMSPARLSLVLAVESMGWFAVAAVGYAINVSLARWAFPAGLSPAVPSVDIRGSRNLFSLDELKHAILSAGGAVLALPLLSGDAAARSITHGQACFVTAAAVCLGAYLAHRLVPVPSARATILSVFLFTIVGYVWSAVKSGATGGPVQAPASPFLRVLPLQSIFVGTAAAVAMFWYMRSPGTAAAPRSQDRG